MAPSALETYVSVDVETGGPVAGVHALLSLGACVVGAAGRTFYAELQPREGTTSVQAALDVAGLDPGRLAVSGTDPDRAARDFARWVSEQAGQARPVFVAFNAPFDWPFVVRFLLAWGVQVPLAWFLGITLGGGLTWMWIGSTIYVALLASVLVARFHSGAWKRIRI